MIINHTTIGNNSYFTPQNKSIKQNIPFGISNKCVNNIIMSELRTLLFHIFREGLGYNSDINPLARFAISKTWMDLIVTGHTALEFKGNFRRTMKTLNANNPTNIFALVGIGLLKATNNAEKFWGKLNK